MRNLTAKAKDYVHGHRLAALSVPLTGASLGSEPFVVVRTSGWLIAQSNFRIGEQALQDEYALYARTVAAAPDPDDVREASRALAEKEQLQSQEEGRGAPRCVDAPVEKKKWKARRSTGAAADIARKKERTAGPFTKSGAHAMFHSTNELQPTRRRFLRDGAAAVQPGSRHFVRCRRPQPRRRSWSLAAS